MKPGSYSGGPLRLIVGVAGIYLNPILRKIFGAALKPVVKEYSLAARWWPKKADGFRIAFLSDLHLPPGKTGVELFEDALSLLQQVQPDLLLLGGDFVNCLYRRSNQHSAVYADLLKKLSARLGVFAVLGNHDWRLAPQAIVQMLEDANIIPLENKSRTISDANVSFTLAGISDYGTRRSLIQKTLPRTGNDDLIFAFTHNPDIFPKLPRRVKILFAGHTHGGQVRLPLLGPILTGNRFRRYNLGMIRENGQTLLVSSGLGCSSLDIRLGCPPEVTVLNLFAKRK